ncbi:DUF2860 domain-containing protein [bacterium]|nr:MAG: DUF2860 domain-containing protein [bacterium]
MIRKTIITLAFIFLAATSVYSADFSNFSLKLSGGLAILSGGDNLSSNRSNAVIPNLYEKPKNRHSINPTLMFDMRYYDERRRNEYYFNPIRMMHGGVSGGVKHKYDKGSIDLSGFFNILDKQWENPYALNRSATPSANYGFDVKTSGLLADSLSLGYKVSFTSIDNDAIGNAYQSLKRDGASHKIHAGYKIKAADAVAITPSLSFERALYSGGANRFSGYGAELGANLRLDEGRMLMAKVSVSENVYDAVHPIFNKKREDTNYGASLMYIIFKPFGWEHWHATMGATHQRSVANIVFFDKEFTVALAALGYTFGKQRGQEDAITIR